MKTIPVIMVGCSCTRLWPLSRGVYQKQFLPLVGEQTCSRTLDSRLRNLIVFVKFRVGHYERNAIISTEGLDCNPTGGFEVGIRRAFDWCLNNKSWVGAV